MDRKKFLKKSVLGAAGIIAVNSVAKAKSYNSTYDKMIDQVGFNHLPNKELKTMKSVLHKAGSRGLADHGWLRSNHSFSFANYYNPERMNFGVIRVLNDDIVAAGKGFGKHPHDNMEIISIPLEGDLEHKDSIGNTAVIKQGDVQIMSAGTGIYHSEFNKNKDKNVKFLQIWLFPNKKNVEPRYDQISLKDIASKNEFYQVLSPDKNDAGVWIHQNAWFHLGEFDQGISRSYDIKAKDNGLYVFVLDGSVKIGDTILNKRDAFGIWETDKIEITAESESKLLLMDVPMTV